MDVLKFLSEKAGLVLLGLCVAGAVAAADIRSLPEYKAAYACAMESIKEKSSGPAAFCVGNSRDPSKVEEQAYTDAEKAASRKLPVDSRGCRFAYGVWIANGSRSDGFDEGPQKVTTLRLAARLAQGRDIQFFDGAGQRITGEVAQRWFVKKAGVVSVSEEARKSCSKKQIG